MVRLPGHEVGGERGRSGAHPGDGRGESGLQLEVSGLAATAPPSVPGDQTGGEGEESEEEEEDNTDEDEALD